MANNVLLHYGVKGQKWGVRRYQNEDGTLTEEGRNRAYALRTHGDVERMYKSFSDKDKRFLDAGEDSSEYMSREATAYWVAKRFIAREGKTPVGWLDIIKSNKEGEANIAIGVDAGHRGKGYASKLVKRGSKWMDAHSSLFNKVEWGAFKENEASIRLAKKNGFALDSESDNFVTYSRKPKRL